MSPENKVKVIPTKINHIFSQDKNAPAEPHNYPINLVLAVNINLAYS